MSLRALGVQFAGVVKTGAKKIKEVNDFMKEDERQKWREAPLHTASTEHERFT